MPHSSGGNVAAIALPTLLYRYFFFTWLFRDMCRGTPLERAAAWRHNRSQAVWLPTYMRRWLCCGALFYLLGAVVELLLGEPMWSAMFYVPSALTVPVNAVIAAAYVGLKVMNAPL
nr:MAG: hypothetical protein DIU74_08615 [Pseudomonadota bacterium]